jgi:hypothetical protein
VGLTGERRRYEHKGSLGHNTHFAVHEAQASQSVVHTWDYDMAHNNVRHQCVCGFLHVAGLALPLPPSLDGGDMSGTASTSLVDSVRNEIRRSGTVERIHQ